MASPDLREAKDAFDAWILKNGLRWTAEGGPLAPGGVDVAYQYTTTMYSCLLQITETQSLRM